MMDWFFSNNNDLEENLGQKTRFCKSIGIWNIEAKFLVESRRV